MAGNDLKQHSLITIVFAFAASVVLVGSLRTWDEPSWWWLVAVVVLVAAGKIVGLNPRSMQPVIVAVAVVLLKAVEGWGLTTAAQTLIRSFAMYPHVYVVTAATALMCLMFDAEQIIAVRPATAMTIALSACLIPGRTAEDLVLTAVVMVVLPVVASLSRVRRMHRFVLLAYAVTEPIIVAAVLWVIERHTAFCFQFAFGRPRSASGSEAAPQRVLARGSRFISIRRGADRERH